MQNFFVAQNFSNILLQSNRIRYCGTASASGSGCETYYEILNVRQDSTTQEIKDAFVKLSKQFHPDARAAQKDGDAKQSAQFVKISEAYQVLSKPKLRSSYDQDLLYRSPYRNTVSQQSGGDGLKTTEIHRPWEVRPNYDPNPGPYYGIKGLSRVSNMKVALALIAIGLFGAIFGFGSVKTYYYFRHSFTFNKQLLDEKSAAANLHHSNIRADAHKFGNEEQLRRIQERIMKENK